MPKPILDISIQCGGMPFDGETPKKLSLGGSETAALCLGRELAALGHKVQIFCNLPDGSVEPRFIDDVHYRPLAEWQNFCFFHPHDVAIVQRAPQCFLGKTAARINMLWCHDLALYRMAREYQGATWNINKIATVSQFHTDQMKKVLGLQDEIFFTSRNGIDVEAIQQGLDGERDLKRIVYTARPERGLDVLLSEVFPRILEKDREFQLHIAGYDNTVPQMAEFYGTLKALQAQLGDRVVDHGPLSKENLYALYRSAGAYAYPTPSPTQKGFREVSCITAMECMAAGLPMVTTKIGALRETLHPDAAVMVDPEGLHTEAYWKRFAEATIGLAADQEAWKRRSDAGIRHARGLGWDGVAAEWEVQILEEIDRANSDPVRLARHFFRQSDIMAATEVLDGIEQEDWTEEAQVISEAIDTSFGDLLNGPERFRNHYEKIGATHTDVFHGVPQEKRLQHLIAWLAQNPDRRRILDYGCAHGAYGIHAMNAQGEGRLWCGMDVDYRSIEIADRDRMDPDRCKYPDRMKFVVGTHEQIPTRVVPAEDDDDSDVVVEEDLGEFDTLLAMEVLEHVPRPWEVVDALEENYLSDGSQVLITVPYGPWEYDSYRSYPHRCHLWEFDLHDLRDMFREKKDVKISAIPFGKSNKMESACGWWLVEYTRDGTPTGRINMERKKRIQVPRQTVSVNIIAGPGAEKTLHWCMQSLVDVADEFVVVDTGLEEETRRILDQYHDPAYAVPLKIIPGPDPKVEGFETPRNIAIENSTMDWILWIDTDERLINDPFIHKYLRPSYYETYMIRQHHFACDTEFPNDLPGRLFRRVRNDGKAMRFFGMIHEHPETGLDEGPGHAIALNDVHIAHVGYLAEPVRKSRFFRNWPMFEADRAKYPNRRLGDLFEMREYMQLIEYELLQNGNNITGDMRTKAERVLELWRKSFRGKPTIMENQALTLMSKANTVLGHGLVVNFGLAIGKEDADLTASQKVRFANENDMMAEIDARMKNQSENLTDKYW